MPESQRSSGQYRWSVPPFSQAPRTSGSFSESKTSPQSKAVFRRTSMKFTDMIADFRLRIADCGLRISDFGLGIVDFVNDHPMSLSIHNPKSPIRILGESFNPQSAIRNRKSAIGNQK